MVVFFHASSNTVVTMVRQDRQVGFGFRLEFVDADSLEVRQSTVTTLGPQLQHFGDLFAITGWVGERASVGVGRVEAGEIECTAEIDGNGETTLGESA